MTLKIGMLWFLSVTRLTVSHTLILIGSNAGGVPQLFWKPVEPTGLYQSEENLQAYGEECAGQQSKHQPFMGAVSPLVMDLMDKDAEN